MSHYSSKWKEFHNRTLAFVVVTVFVVAIGLMFIMGSFLVRYSPPLGVVVPLVAAIIVFGGIVAWRYLHWPCPNCGKPFAGIAHGRMKFLPLNCVHCGEKAFVD
jgi:hypothetical protein